LSTQTKSGFKCYSLSFYNRALVLFIKKKNNSLKLYIDYHRLNKITYKDYYSISLVANLLDTPKKTRYYTKINLRNAYYLIYITNFIQTITPGILDQFRQSKWPPKALKKTFLMVPKTSQSNQYSPSYQQISLWSPSHQTLNRQYLRNCLT